ncbi:MAG TPA: MOSC domain-containing protein [Anaerolineae bacterium]|nr:MOSC domain-containing protein [Anaerolineae bacterium]HPL28257.1 MOSC domain-containing protein [Anaerolineae bacterium]
MRASSTATGMPQGEMTTLPVVTCPGSPILLLQWTTIRTMEARMAHVVAVCASVQREDSKVDLGEGELIAGYGLLGDAHAGRGERQVSLLAVESIERARQEHGTAAVPGSFAENLTTEGLDLSVLVVGDRLRVGAALLQVVQLGKPPEAAHTYSFQGVSLLPRAGVFCRVLEGGRVARGDVVEVLSGGEAV